MSKKQKPKLLTPKEVSEVKVVNTQEENIQAVLGFGLASAYDLALGAGATAVEPNAQQSKYADVDALPTPKKK